MAGGRPVPEMAPEDDGALRPSGLGASEPGDVRAEVAIRVAPINRVIWIVASILIVATFAAQIVHEVVGLNTVVTLFDADVKQNFPTAAKILLLLGCTILFAAIALTGSDRSHRLHWFGISGLFALLTLDEMMYMHQRLSDGLHNVFGAEGPLRFAWVLVYLPVLAGLLVVYWPFWRRLGEPIRTRLLVAAVCFAAGAGGLQFVKGSLYDGDDWQLSFALAAAASDSLELIGLAVLVTSLLVALARDTAHFDLSLRE